MKKPSRMSPERPNAQASPDCNTFKNKGLGDVGEAGGVLQPSSSGNGQAPDGSPRQCAQCGTSDEPLQFVGTPDGTAWLHRRCERLWLLQEHPQSERIIASVHIEEIPGDVVLQ